MVQGIFKSLTNRSKPKFNIGWSFNVAFSFTHLHFKGIIFFPSLCQNTWAQVATIQLPQVEQVSTCQSCTQEAKEAEVKIKPHLLPLQVTKINFPGLASTLQQQASQSEGQLSRKEKEELRIILNCPIPFLLSLSASSIPISTQRWPSKERLGKFVAPFFFFLSLSITSPGNLNLYSSLKKALRKGLIKCIYTTVQKIQWNHLYYR